jgi:reductive dehalogenase
MVRVFKMITDLPVAVDKPIDAGIMAYCRTCQKCAEACPPGALSFSEEPSWVTVGGWNNPGHKAYFEDSVKCQSYWMNGAGTNCGICLAVCPFSKSDKAWVHNLARATVAMTPGINGVLRSLDDAFSYGAQKDPEEWWNLDLPEYGIDSDRTSKR